MRTNFYRILFLMILVLFISYRGNAEEEIKEDPVLRDLIIDYSDKAYNYFKININLDSAEYYYKKAIDLAYSSSNYNIGANEANNYISLASLYRNIYNNSEALAMLNIAEEILMKINPNDPLLGTLYHNKGNIFKVQNDLYSTKEYYEYALDFYIKNGYQNTNDFVFVYSNYIELLFELKEYELAEQKLSMIDLDKIHIEPIIEFRFHNTNASLYSQLGKYEIAKQHFTECLRILRRQSNLKEYTREILNYYYNIIGFYMSYGDYDQAQKECDNAIIYIESLDPHAIKTKLIYRSDIAYRSASIQLEEGNLDKSLYIIL